MTFTEFANKVAEEVGKRLPEYDGFIIEDVNKVNVGQLKGLAAKIEDGAVPIIYLEKYYYDFKSGKSLVDICDELAKEYKEADRQVVPNDRLLEPEYVRDNLIVKLLSYDLNKNLLDNYIYRKVDDYIIVPFVEIDFGDHLGEVKFTSEHFKSFGFDTDEVIDEAIARTQKRYPAVLNSVGDKLQAWNDDVTNYLESDETPEDGLLVLTNTRSMEGAVALYYPGVLKKVGELLGDFYLIPSSINEFLVVKKIPIFNKQMLTKTVLDVNKSLVSETEWLGERVLEYSTISHCFVI